MISRDTSALFALAKRSDPDHEAARVALVADRGPYLVPAGILAEIGYLLEQRLPLAVAPFLADLRSVRTPSTAARRYSAVCSSWWSGTRTFRWASPTPA